MYLEIERTASALWLPLRWPPRLPNSRIALAATEWVRRQQPDAFAAVQARLFRAHFADGLNIGDIETVLNCVAEGLSESVRLREALSSTEPFTWIEQGEEVASFRGDRHAEVADRRSDGQRSCSRG
jgi:predicted DsbA family dithiol-disulfide isomerase